MKKEQKVIEFYVLCNKLKNVVRTGWKDWNVKRDRLESIAEHIYGVQMLALSMWSEFKYDIDIKKVILMLAVHELEEIIIGDLTQFQIEKEDKEKLGHDAVKKILSGLLKGEEVEKIIFEFDKQETKEAYFAYQCDKLECDLQAKLYGEENCVDLLDQENNPTSKHERVQKLLNSGKPWEEMWILFGQEKYNYDENFLAVSNFALKNNMIKHDDT